MSGYEPAPAHLVKPLILTLVCLSVASCGMVLRRILRLCLGTEIKNGLVDRGCLPQVMEGMRHTGAGTYCLWIYELVEKGPSRIWHQEALDDIAGQRDKDCLLFFLHWYILNIHGKIN